MLSDATEHRFHIVAREDCDAKTLAADFANGIAAAVDAGAPAGLRLQGILDVGFRSTAADEAELVILLKEPDRRVGHKLAHPSYAAEGAPGPWLWERRDESGGLLMKRKGLHADALEIEYCVIDDAEIAFNAYERSEIDATSPVLHTPELIKRLVGRSDFQKSIPNTFFVLFPNSAVGLEPDVRRGLRDCLDVQDIADRLTPSISPVRGFSRLSQRHHQLEKAKGDFDLSETIRLPLTVAYDPYPPNREIAEAVARAWPGEVTLIPDDFAVPSALCDFRLIIIVNSHAYEADAYRMLGRTAGIRSDPHLNERWQQLISSYDAAQNTVGRASAIHALDNLLATNSPAILLARLNAFHLQRPILSWLDYASDYTWERSW